MLGGEKAPFVGRPPSQSFGYLSREDQTTPYSEDEIKNLNDAKIAYGDEPLTFERLEGESPSFRGIQWSRS